jgi:predicted nucleic acid-binding protein
LPASDAERYVADFGRFPFATVDHDTVTAACRRARADRLSYWDALIVETARGAGCTELLTEDLQAGRDFDGLLVVNPYATR